MFNEQLANSVLCAFSIISDILSSRAVAHKIKSMNNKGICNTIYSQDITNLDNIISKDNSLLKYN